MTRPLSAPPASWVEISLEWEEIDRWLALLLMGGEPVIAVRSDGPPMWLEEHNAPLFDEYTRYFRERPAPIVIPVTGSHEEAEEDERPVDAEETWVEFRFEYPDRSPVSGIDYVLVDPARNRSGGTLGANGTITKRGGPRGGYTVILADVEAAFFAHKRRACDDELAVTARTSGYPDGTAAKVRLYRELRESADDALAEVDAVVIGDRVEATLRYDYAADEDRAAETGVVRLIAEVSVDDGKAWAKTDPLELALKTIQRVSWSADRVQPGDPVNVVVETAGYPSGASAKIEIWRLDWLGGSEKVAEVASVPIQGGRAVAHGAYAASGADFTIDRSGEHYAIAVIEDNVTRSRRSDLVWCAWSESADDDTSEAA